MNNNLEKTYNPKEFENRIYKKWENSGAFHATRDESKKSFTIVMPPPNITGQLHMGHALDHILQDVLIRWKRMQGFEALWLPGSDHASIATEVKVVEKIRIEEGKTKEELGREEFLKRAWEWKETYGGKITRQCRKLGDSCDWERERFTMDEGCNKAVTEFFVRLYEKGLIYKGNRIINWCPSCGTSLSDAEVEHNDKNGKYYYIRYPGEDGGEGIVIATSRPETMFGDVAVAVHPDDERYKDLVGKNVVLPLVNRVIPVIIDPFPDPEKGTGAVKITPAHDPNDFEVGLRHNLPTPCCIDDHAKMTELAGKYAGMDRYQCRKAWLSDLEEANFVIKAEDMVIPIGECYRCKEAIEPMLSEQWFVRMEELAKPAIEAARKGDLTHVPQRFEKIYLHWLEEIRDWCISRQLWWGHRIPAYYCQVCKELIVARIAPEKCTKCGSKDIKQDEDVLDTWFSSALWPFSTLGWPEQTSDLEYFYPTDVLVTGYDIIFFWVVRMVFSALEIMGEVPFQYVYVHGLVRDAEGRKMSKSLGNGVDPLEVIDHYGADALRFMLSTGISPGNDLRFKMDRLESCRNFANKLWNASRFVIMNLQDQNSPDDSFDSEALKMEDKWILSKVNATVQEITDNMDHFDLALAGQKVYELIWNEYCDWYIELVKPRLYGDDEEDKRVVRFVLVRALKDMLRLLHPFMPFITEEIWSYLPGTHNLLIRDSWPVYNENITYDEEVKDMELAMEIIKTIRNIRAEAEAPPSRKLRAVILTREETLNQVKSGESYIKNLANIREIRFIQDKGQIPEEVMSGVVGPVEIFIPQDDLLDYVAEFQRLEKEKSRLAGEVKRITGKLDNTAFVSKAPEQIVEKEREKLTQYRDMLCKVEERLKLIQKKL
ncbi:MAG: valine--tRNA ligase [Eubacteriales bacterium]|nr:valine--tRNA ligase [Eubacteriales bacterium]MDD4583261.1 valine--tRNA ligase [Eubacteriales bacterium]